ncbi:MAG: hypothetical protein R3D70_06020 [Rhizobiaceae bacterium]
MRGIAVLLIAISVVAPASAEEWWHGDYVWAGSILPCENNDSVARYREKTVEFWESSCDIQKVTNLIGLEGVILNLKCTEATEEFQRRTLLMRDHEGITSFPPAKRLQSCDAPMPQPVASAQPEPVKAAKCDFNSQVFRSPIMNNPDPNSYQELRFVSGLTDGVVEITETRAGKAVWRARGKHVCSNGAVICQVEFPRKVNDPLSLPYEALPSADGSMAESIVIPSFRQTVYLSERGAVFEDVGYGGLVSDLLEGFVPQDDEILMPHNVYTYASCAN